ncbi:hypothetical protein SCUCBS95973_001006 [Sporothrix curviconia]|uniref:Mesaconyl-C4 CoA hydratase n=1 Tax=Sporothrix curviconia TaxID=1260050 RepID=A0ABP0AUZ0_9PEZI
MNTTTQLLRPSRHLLRHVAVRLFSTSRRCRQQQKNASADEAAQRMLETHGRTTVVRRQLIDPNQLAKLAFTLGRPTVSGVAVADDTVLPAGTPVPAGYHLVYFTPGGVEADLGRDGTDRSFNAPAPFSRRMWAGGAMEWKGGEEGGGGGGGGDQIIKVGDEVEERTRLLSATPKTSKSTGAGMVLVEVEKELWSPRGLAVVDRRSWIFRPAVTAADLQAAQPPPFLPNSDSVSSVEDHQTDGGGLVRSFTWSPVGLFRFSALTFNGHKIHYNEDWTHKVESHAGLVVHGPLNLINLLNYWQDAHGSVAGRSVKKIAYRAVSPIYAGQPYQVRTKAEGRTEAGERKWHVVAEKNGTACMVAEIE